MQLIPQQGTTTKNPYMNYIFVSSKLPEWLVRTYSNPYVRGHIQK